MKFRNLISTTFLFSLLISSNALASGGLTGWYQSNGGSNQNYYNQGSYNTNQSYNSNYGQSYNQNYNNVGIRNYNGYTPSNNNYRNPLGGGLTAYYGANNFNVAPSNNTYVPPAATLTDSRGGLTDYYAANNFNTTNNNTYTPPTPSDGRGGFTQYFSTNLQANTFASQCNPVLQPNPTTCQGGSYQEIKNNYGCTIDWRCEGGNFCPDIQRPRPEACNGTWEPQHNAATQCLTHYFCDRSPDVPEVCPTNYAPICGRDGTQEITYTNECYLAQAEATLLHEGRCETTPNPVTQPVIQSFNGPTNLEVNKSGTWTVRASGGRNAQLSYAIDWGEYDYANASQSLRRFPVQQTTFTHQYANAGTYTVRITVSNQNGQQATSQTTVKVGGGSVSKPNITSFTGPTSLRVGEKGTFNVNANHPYDKGVNFSVDWGEAHYGQQNQTSQIRRGSSQTFDHTFNIPGTFHVRVTAETDGQQDTRTLTVRVTGGATGTAPVVRGISGPATLTTGQTGTWSVQASDPNNGNLSYQINWGDEMYGAQSNYAGSDGYVQNSAFTHYYSQAGTYTVSVVIRNDSGQTARASTTVRVGRERIYEPYQASTPNYNTNDYRPSYNYNGGDRHSIFNRGYGW